MDDVLDVTSLQGVPGVIGSILVGFFADSSVQRGNPGRNGIFYGNNGSQLGVQTLACILAIVWSGFWTYIIMLIITGAVGMDVKPHVEEVGLDIEQIGEQAYDDTLNPLLDLGEDIVAYQLCEAAAHGRLTEIKKLFLMGISLEHSDYDGRTPLILAASEGHLEVCKYIHDKGVDLNTVDRMGNTAFSEALSNGHKHIVDWLHRNGVKQHVGDSKAFSTFNFIQAAAEGNDEKLNKYFKVCKNSDDRKKIANAKDYDGRTALHLAVAEGSHTCVKLLLQNGANVNTVDRWNLSPIDEAFTTKQWEIKELLMLHSSSDSETRNPILDDKPENSNSLLLKRNIKTYNSTDDNKVIIQLTQSSKTSEVIVNARELCKASANNDLTEVTRIVKKDPDCPGYKDYDGRTSLMVASFNGCMDVVKFLVDNFYIGENALNINDVDRWHRNALQDAMEVNIVI